MVQIEAKTYVSEEILKNEYDYTYGEKKDQKVDFTFINTENTSQANPSDPAQKARQVILNSLLYDSFSRMARYYSRSGRLLSGKKRWYNNLIA